jgi:hypothetical protein
MIEEMKKTVSYDYSVNNNCYYNPLIGDVCYRFNRSKRE